LMCSRHTIEPQHGEKALQTPTRKRISSTRATQRMRKKGGMLPADRMCVSRWKPALAVYQPTVEGPLPVDNFAAAVMRHTEEEGEDTLGDENAQ
jgi:hypothetical protein